MRRSPTHECARVEVFVKEKCRKAAMAAYEWGVLSRIVLGDGESPLQGEGRDGST